MGSAKLCAENFRSEPQYCLWMNPKLSHKPQKSDNIEVGKREFNKFRDILNT